MVRYMGEVSACKTVELARTQDLDTKLLCRVTKALSESGVRDQHWPINISNTDCCCAVVNTVVRRVMNYVSMTSGIFRLNINKIGWQFA